MAQGVDDPHTPWALSPAIWGNSHQTCLTLTLNLNLKLVSLPECEEALRVCCALLQALTGQEHALIVASYAPVSTHTPDFDVQHL